MASKTIVNDTEPLKRTRKTKIRTVTVVNTYYIGDKKMNDVFEQALIMELNKHEAMMKSQADNI